MKTADKVILTCLTVAVLTTAAIIIWDEQCNREDSVREPVITATDRVYTLTVDFTSDTDLKDVKVLYGETDVTDKAQVVYRGSRNITVSLTGEKYDDIYLLKVRA